METFEIVSRTGMIHVRATDMSNAKIIALSQYAKNGYSSTVIVSAKKLAK